MKSVAASAYRPFSVVGLEVEHAIVDASFRPACVVEDLLRTLAGRPTSDAILGPIGFSNELAAHVIEVKNVLPERSLALAARRLAAGVRRSARILREEHGASLLPTGMHPLMTPSETRLWSRSGGRIYRAYDQVFGVGGHGWLNLQSCHVNLPFGTEEETVAIHDAAVLLLPYLPALAASSPLVEGKFGPHVCNRLTVYRKNQARIPAVGGGVIPEWMTSTRGYVRDVLRPIYRELGEVKGGEILRHEWVNSRGVIPRFMRSAFEVRVLDAQECVRADAALAAFVRGAMAFLTRGLLEGTAVRPERAALVADLDSCIREGRKARVMAPHLGVRGSRAASSRTARGVLETLLVHAEASVPASDRPLLRLVEDRLAHGSLSERIRAALPAGADGRPKRASVIALYRELSGRLEADEPWLG